MKWSIQIFICGAGALVCSWSLSPPHALPNASAHQTSPTKQGSQSEQSPSSPHHNGDHHASDPWVRIILNNELSSGERLQPMVDGRLWRVESPAAIAALRAILGDPEAGDTFRNEVANLLFRSEASGMADDLLQVIRNDSGAQRDRFRSFAVQHLG